MDLAEWNAKQIMEMNSTSNLIFCFVSDVHIKELLEGGAWKIRSKFAVKASS
jgi:hypothetical protein